MPLLTDSEIKHGRKIRDFKSFPKCDRFLYLIIIFNNSHSTAQKLKTIISGALLVHLCDIVALLVLMLSTHRRKAKELSFCHKLKLHLCNQISQTFFLNLKTILLFIKSLHHPVAKIWIRTLFLYLVSCQKFIYLFCGINYDVFKLK